MKSEFDKILNQHLQKLLRDETPEAPAVDSLYIESNNWSHIKSDGPKRSVRSSSYIQYQKDPEVIRNEQSQREKQSIQTFLAGFSSEKVKRAAEFFLDHGARRCLSFRVSDLKRDFRAIALKVHPDRFHSENAQKKALAQEEFRLLKESFQVLETAFSLTK